MTFLLIMGMVVLVLLGAISVLAASAAGRLDLADDEGLPLSASGAEVAWSAISLVVGGFLVLFAILGALLRAEPSWLSSLFFGLLYVYRGIQGLRA